MALKVKDENLAKMADHMFKLNDQPNHTGDVIPLIKHMNDEDPGPRRSSLKS